MKRTFAAAFPVTAPVLMGYLAIGVVFGWMLSAIGYNPLWSVAMSVTIYAGSGQYLGVSLLENAAPLADVAFLTLVINFRHLVYGLSMLEKFKGMGWRKIYMIFSLTDETYALLAGVKAPEGVDERAFTSPSPCSTRSTGWPGPCWGPWPEPSSPSTPTASTLP